MVFKTTQNDDLIAAALVKHMVKSGVKTIGFIGFKDPYGENWHSVFTPMAEKAGINVVATEYYQRTDPSVTGQALKLIAAKPDAVLSPASAVPACFRRSRCAIKDTKARSTRRTAWRPTTSSVSARTRSRERCWRRGRCCVIDEIPKRIHQEGRAGLHRGIEKRFGQKPATFGANTWDSGSSCSARFPSRSRQASPAPKRSAAALRDAIEAEREIVGCQGVFNMSPSTTTGWTSARACSSR